MAFTMSVEQTAGANPSLYQAQESIAPNNGSSVWGIKLADPAVSTFNSSIQYAFLPPVPFLYTSTLVSTMSNNPTFKQENKFWITANPPYTPFYTEQNYNSSFALAQNVVAPFTPLAYTEYFDIVSDNLAKFSKVKDAMTRQYQGQTNVLARVFLTPYSTRQESTDYFSLPFKLAVDYTTPKTVRWLPNEFVNDFDLKLYDQYGELLYWDEQNSTEYQLNIQASET
jgi:hypothetical protein